MKAAHIFFFSFILSVLFPFILQGQTAAEFIPSEILNEINRTLNNTLKQNNEEPAVKDGMDIALCSIDRRIGILQFAGANNPLWLVRNNEIKEIKGDKIPIGSFYGKEPGLFKNHEVTLEKGDTIYIFTDGFADQFGGEKGKKFKYSRLKQLLLAINKKELREQKNVLKKSFDDWKGKLEQVDDVCIIGLRI